MEVESNRCKLQEIQANYLTTTTLSSGTMVAVLGDAMAAVTGSAQFELVGVNGVSVAF